LASVEGDSVYKTTFNSLECVSSALSQNKYISLLRQQPNSYRSTVC